MTCPPRARPARVFYGTGTPGTARIVVNERRGVIVGATFTGTDVADWLQAATITIVSKTPVELLWQAVPAFPTRSEIWLKLLERREADLAAGRSAAALSRACPPWPGIAGDRPALTGQYVQIGTAQHGQAPAPEPAARHSPPAAARSAYGPGPGGSRARDVRRRTFLGRGGAIRSISGMLQPPSATPADMTADLTYRQVCGHRTGHAESAEVWFDPAQVDYALRTGSSERDLLRWSYNSQPRRVGRVVSHH